MGHTTTEMALSLFDNPPFFHPHGLAPRSSLFTEMDSMLHNHHSMFGSFNHRRDKFLSDMEVEAPDNRPHSFSYTSSSVKTGNGDAVVRKSERYHDAQSGEMVERTSRSVGDRSVQEVGRGGNTTRTLTNIGEDELEAFDAEVEQRRRSLFAAPQQLELPPALEQDLA